MKLDHVLQRADVWRGGEHALRRGADVTAFPTSFPALDVQLPGGGWPVGALTELLSAHRGIGELELLLPALARLSRSGRSLAWVAPPYHPYAPPLAAAGVDLERLLLIQPTRAPDRLWALEQTLRSGACGAVLGWLPAVDSRSLRRLQLAAETGRAVAVLFRPLSAARRPSPAALRLQLEPAADGMTLHILKRRGPWPSQPVTLPRAHAVA